MAVTNTRVTWSYDQASAKLNTTYTATTTAKEGSTTGTIMGIPKGAKNPGAAWELIKHLTFDTDTIVSLSNAIKNVPSTKAALDSPQLEVDEQFKTFENNDPRRVIDYQQYGRTYLVGINYRY